VTRANVYQRVLDERFQTPASRRELFRKVSTALSGRSVVTFFTSFRYPVEINDGDCDMLQSVLQQTDLAKGLALMINSLGGDTLAAERIVNICRAYSGTGEYWALVPGRAKSAATIICMGASKIIMAPPSELGPVDPQIIREEDGQTKWFSAFSLVTGYKTLFNDAVGTKGNVEPFVQQLAHYDIRDINTWQGFIDVSKDIAIKILASGMMAGTDPSEIERKIKVFLDPSAGTQHHGRAIYASEAKACGLAIEEMQVKSPHWDAVYELYYRSDLYVNTRVAKIVESQSEAFYTAAPEQKES
jgi:Serine dehydrogenase proteinase